MKTWTVVVELKTFDELDANLIRDLVGNAIGSAFSGGFQIFEVTNAPYGPSGMSLIENKIGRAGRIQTAPVICVCNPKSEYISRNCNATEHKTAKTFNNTCSKTCRPIGGAK